ncbi:hypothetical protein AB4851_10995 [Burkholderia sp. 22PA0099]|uniref:hypothetical protein n=1 Tax=Burkholderia sp. 22PA0099 TaxID=3237372 RepID=UPI0039C311E1
MKKLDRRVGVVIAMSGVIFMAIAIKNNPTDTAKKLHVMRHDVRVILINGGVVVTDSCNSKYGSAYYYAGIDAKSWSPILADSYSKGLLALGWKERGYEGDIFFVKMAFVPKYIETSSMVMVRRCTGLA